MAAETTDTAQPVSAPTLDHIRESAIGFGDLAARQWISGVLHEKLQGFAKAGASRGQVISLLDGICEGALRAIADVREGLGGNDGGTA